MTRNIILFDGECHFCDHSVQFILQRDLHGHFYFSSLQSETGQNLLDEYGIDKDTDSFVLLENKRGYIKSTAALRVCRKLTGVWKIFSFLTIIPRPFRDFIYDIIATNRYKWFGKKASCNLPSKEIRKRFLD
ncbi:thiol-disulfide oxidoreductase DCC family protein [Alteribacter populi]|uniref:thiol-disulfide oxidoreductase DCC family protein n=1 Tax=Alteribacter populi TaxID=2011011 RepID=UPI000BBA5F20|nr:thiol-disulfide oxidoreductase DCC family protein [Alteribacter populi]